jgi:hypothetical protein
MHLSLLKYNFLALVGSSFSIINCSLSSKEAGEAPFLKKIWKQTQPGSFRVQASLVFEGLVCYPRAG